MTRLLTGTLLLAALSPLGSSAQTIPSSYTYIERGQEAGVFLGNFSAATGRFDLGPRSGPMLGGRYNLEVGGPVFLEGIATYFSTDRDVIDPRRVEGDRAIGRSPVDLVAIDVRLAFSLTGRRTWHGLSPYISAGGGLAFDVAGSSEADALLLPEDQFDFGTTFTGSFGGGVRYLLSEALVLRADFALSLWKLDTPTGFDDPDKGIERVPEDEWVGGTGLTIGAAIRF